MHIRVVELAVLTGGGKGTDDNFMDSLAVLSHQRRELHNGDINLDTDSAPVIL